MPIVFSEGFDWIDASNSGSQIRDLLQSQKWRMLTGGTLWSIIPGRGGTGQALQCPSDTSVHIMATPILQATTTDSEVIFGGAVKLGASFVDNRAIWALRVGGQIQIAIRFETSDDSFHLFRGDLGSSIANSPSLTSDLTLGAWHFIEWKMRVSDTSGFISMRINGKTVWESATNLDTKQMSESVHWDNVWFRPAAWTPLPVWDDIYIADNQGSENNDFIGDIKIRTITPTQDGSQTQFTPSTGSDHTLLINDIPFIDLPTDVDFVETNQIDGLELFEFSDIPTSQVGAVVAVQVNSISRITDAQPRDVQVVAQLKDHNKDIALSTADPTGSSVVRDDTYLDNFAVFQTDPDGRQWNSRSINKAQFGVKLEA